MSNLWQRLLDVFAQFLVGYILLSVRGGKKKFVALLWRNATTQAFIIFNLSLLPGLITFFFGCDADRTILWHFLAISAIWVVIYSVALSVFDIPNFVVEKKRLNEYIRGLNPLNIFLYAPLRWIQGVIKKRRTP